MLYLRLLILSFVAGMLASTCDVSSVILLVRLLGALLT